MGETKSINQRFEAVCEQQGWTISDIDHLSDGLYIIEINTTSAYGQDVFEQVQTYSFDDKDIEKALHETFEAYDVDEETMLWLDGSGHGKNGAPYSMKDVREDMQGVKDSLYGLYQAFVNYGREKEPRPTMEVRLAYRSEIYLRGTSMEDIVRKFESLNLDPIDKGDEAVADYSFCEVVSVEDASDYRDIKNEFDKVWRGC